MGARLGVAGHSHVRGRQGEQRERISDPGFAGSRAGTIVPDVGTKGQTFTKFVVLCGEKGAGEQKQGESERLFSCTRLKRSLRV